MRIFLFHLYALAFISSMAVGISSANGENCALWDPPTTQKLVEWSLFESRPIKGVATIHCNYSISPAELGPNLLSAKCSVSIGGENPTELPNFRARLIAMLSFPNSHAGQHAVDLELSCKKIIWKRKRSIYVVSQADCAVMSKCKETQEQNAAEEKPWSETTIKELGIQPSQQDGLTKPLVLQIEPKTVSFLLSMETEKGISLQVRGKSE